MLFAQNSFTRAICRHQRPALPPFLGQLDDPLLAEPRRIRCQYVSQSDHWPGTSISIARERPIDPEAARRQPHVALRRQPPVLALYRDPRSTSVRVTASRAGRCLRRLDLDIGPSGILRRRGGCVCRHGEPAAPRGEQKMATRKPSVPPVSLPARYPRWNWEVWRQLIDSAAFGLPMTTRRRDRLGGGTTGSAPHQLAMPLTLGIRGQRRQKRDVEARARFDAADESAREDALPKCSL